MTTARDLMTAKPMTVPETAKVRRAVEILQEMEIRHLPVVNATGELVGMLSDRDLRSLAIPWFAGREHTGEIRTALEARVSSLMSGDVISVQEETDVSEIVDLMLENKVGALPVTDGDGALVGIISYVDVLRAMARAAS